MSVPFGGESSSECRNRKLDTTLREKSHYHGIDFLEASYEGGDSDTSVTVRPISVEEKVEESDEEEFEENVEVEKMGEEAERFEAEDEGEFIRKINDPKLPPKGSQELPDVPRGSQNS